MHYKNGREAKNGDKVIVMPQYGSPYVGILYDAVAGNDYCNGKVAVISGNDPCPNLKECLHIEDIAEKRSPVTNTAIPSNLVLCQKCGWYHEPQDACVATK